MREIKFRAWDKRIKEMTYDVALFAGEIYGLDYDEVKDGCSAWSSDTKNFELMQYTGLKDKNGKEIYEGDIIKHNLYKAEYRVGYFEAEARFALYNKFGKGKYYLHFPNEFEVIGNVYENPELLKGG